MELSGKNASLTSHHRRWIAFIGTIAVAVLAYLISESLRDWDFYYRLTLAASGSEASLDLRGERSPWLTRVILSHEWALYLPALILAVALIAVPRKTASFAAELSGAAALVTLTLGYLAAYLPVAKPDWWWTGRPEELIGVAERQASFYQAAAEARKEDRKKDAPREE
ncbi:hypothetical protein OKA05_27110 [Luteolibacter arcticus]|uniref:Peptidase S54 rhomboid domain-containing protein n=1 Tax=Luteolibacter arcticus TaxID=1581411 RepID=A0ABT3GS15_9BACT|nr:hypothetical protein [Luteolibacter arcticus]MCW1926253.1 hypothetical protein [Luteolibacter arcticus]